MIWDHAMRWFFATIWADVSKGDLICPKKVGIFNPPHLTIFFYPMDWCSITSACILKSRKFPFLKDVFLQLRNENGISTPFFKIWNLSFFRLYRQKQDKLDLI